MIIAVRQHWPMSKHRPQSATALEALKLDDFDRAYR